MTNRLLIKHNGEFVDVGVDNGITQFDNNKTYRINDQVWYIFNNELRYYLSLTDNNRGNNNYDYNNNQHEDNNQQENLNQQTTNNFEQIENNCIGIDSHNKSLQKHYTLK